MLGVPSALNHGGCCGPLQAPASYPCHAVKGVGSGQHPALMPFVTRGELETLATYVSMASCSSGRMYHGTVDDVVGGALHGWSTSCKMLGDTSAMSVAQQRFVPPCLLSPSLLLVPPLLLPMLPPPTSASTTMIMPWTSSVIVAAKQAAAAVVVAAADPGLRDLPAHLTAQLQMSSPEQVAMPPGLSASVLSSLPSLPWIDLVSLDTGSYAPIALPALTSLSNLLLAQQVAAAGLVCARS